MPTCHSCKAIVPTIKALTAHRQITHRSDISQKFICGETNCYGKFNVLKNFVKHLKNIHGFSNDPSGPVSVTSDVTCTKNISENEDIVMNENIDVDSFPQEEEYFDPSLADFKSAVLAQSEAFVAKLYSAPALARNQVQNIINDADAFMGSGFLNILKEKCLYSLNKCAADVTEIKDIQNMFEVLQEPFVELKTEYLRIKRFMQSGCYIAPISHPLGKELRLVKNANGGSKPAWVPVTEEFIPLRLVFKKFLELSNCLQDILCYLETLKKETDTVSNFVQGELFQSKLQNFKPDDIVFPLFAYFDDLQCNASLGPHVGPGKVGAVYTSIPCLPPECQGALKNIFLSVLFCSQNRDEFGNEKVLDPFIKELTYLEKEGIEIETGEGKQRIYFVLGLITADNLGIHQLCNLVESFSANYPCRFCKATKANTERQIELDASLLRNKENYEADVRLCDVSLTGINGECEFNKIPSFHFTENYCVDFMHDIAEWIIPEVLAFLINYAIKEKYFTLKTLNHRIKMFDFGPHVSNKPPCISTESLQKGKLKMTASESLWFARYFGLIIGDLIPANSLQWRLYICLMRIVDIVLAKSVPRAMCDTFPVLVKDFLGLYLKLGNYLKPKFHFLLHYADVMKKSGPVYLLSTMRFEAKHRELKQSAVTNTSRINLPHSMAIKHQLKLCSRFIANQCILPDLEIGPTDQITLSTHEDFSVIFSSLSPWLRKQNLATVVHWVNIKGTLYSSSMVLLTGRDEVCFWPMFGKIKYIIMDEDNDPLFVCSKLHNLGLSDHFYAYEVQQTSEIVCVKYHDMLTFHPAYDQLICNGERFVAVRSMV